MSAGDSEWREGTTIVPETASSWVSAHVTAAPPCCPRPFKAVRVSGGSISRWNHPHLRVPRAMHWLFQSRTRWTSGASSADGPMAPLRGCQVEPRWRQRHPRQNGWLSPHRPEPTFWNSPPQAWVPRNGWPRRPWSSVPIPGHPQDVTGLHRRHGSAARGTQSKGPRMHLPLSRGHQSLVPRGAMGNGHLPSSNPIRKRRTPKRMALVLAAI